MPKITGKAINAMSRGFFNVLVCLDCSLLSALVSLQAATLSM
jgi:hypothetical protein